MSLLEEEALSNILGISERIVRAETEFLKEQQLIDVAVSGMTITKEGAMILDELKDFMYEVKGLSTLQEEVKTNIRNKKSFISAR